MHGVYGIVLDSPPYLMTVQHLNFRVLTTMIKKNKVTRSGYVGIQIKIQLTTHKNNLHSM